MKKMTATADERFYTGADKYVAYLETPEGRLRSDLAFANLQEFLPQVSGSLCVLDLGCGTGALGVRLARLGFQVTLLDSSPPMLDFGKSAAAEAGVTEKVELMHGDAANLATLFHGRSFDGILCHNILEYLGDPGGVLCGASEMLRNSSAVLSILVRNQAGEVLKAAIKDGDLAAAGHSLTAEWARESLYGVDVRLFTPEALQPMLQAASLKVAAKRGVRVMSDYLPPRISRTAEYDRIFELERQLAFRPEFAAVARYMQYIAHRAGPATKDGRE
jgi:SAM-dependent methyltransferase